LRRLLTSEAPEGVADILEVEFYATPLQACSLAAPVSQVSGTIAEVKYGQATPKAAAGAMLFDRLLPSIVGRRMGIIR
jgi:hypothetical protein